MPVPIQNLEIEIIDLETLYLKDIEVIPTIGIETVQIIEIAVQAITTDKRNYSQSPHRNNTRYQNSHQNYGSSTPKHQRQTNQVRSTEETQPDTPGIEKNESTELQLNHLNCESTDNKSYTENTISINLINVENDLEPDIYEQPIYSHLYQNQDQFLLNYYTRPISNTTTKKKQKKK